MKTHYDKAIGSRITAFRNKKGLTQQDMADKLDLSRASIVNIEKGRQSLNVNTLIEIGQILDLSCSSILADTKPHNDLTDPEVLGFEHVTGGMYKFPELYFWITYDEGSDMRSVIGQSFMAGRTKKIEEIKQVLNINFHS